MFLVAPMFAPTLLRMRQKALRQYSTQGVELGRLYHEEWVRGINGAGDSLLSTPHNTTLAKL